MVILRTRNKITDFLMILALASPFNYETYCLVLELAYILKNVNMIKLKNVLL